MLLIKQSMIGTLMIIGVLASFTNVQAQTNIEKNEICVKNETGKSFVFAAQADKDGERIVKALVDGEKLCVSSASNSNEGVVSVYEEADAMEGCSRIINTGTLEILFKFAGADRCLWSSNS